MSINEVIGDKIMLKTNLNSLIMNKKSAIEWLNNNTPTIINFFLIEIHVYKM